MPSSPAREPFVEVWWVATAPLADSDGQARLRACLTPEDLARLARAAPPRHATERLAAWALARVALSRHAGVPPEAWRFREGAHGRPELAGPPGAPPLDFNISHTTGLAVCAVTVGAAVGADVEDLERDVDVARLADRVLAPPEAGALATAADDERRRRAFFECWTLKEAYLKARGTGLSRPLAGIAFSLGTDGTPSVAFGPGIADDPAAWHFFLLRPTRRHVAAVALRRPRATPVRLVLRQALPELHLFPFVP